MGFLRGACANTTYTLRRTYVYVRSRTPIIRLYAILRVSTPISYAISTLCQCIRRRTPAYADPAIYSLQCSLEYAYNFGVEGTRDNATLRGPGVKGALGSSYAVVEIISLHRYTPSSVD